MLGMQSDEDLIIAMKVDDLPALEEVESAYLEMVLDIHRGDKRAAARTLGVSLKTVYNKIARIEAGRALAEKGA